MIDSSFQKQMKRTSAFLNGVGTTEEGVEEGTSAPIGGVKKNRDLATLEASDGAKVFQHFLSETCNYYEAILFLKNLLTRGCPFSHIHNSSRIR